MFEEGPLPARPVLVSDGPCRCRGSSLMVEGRAELVDRGYLQSIAEGGLVHLEVRLNENGSFVLAPRSGSL